MKSDSSPLPLISNLPSEMVDLIISCAVDLKKGNRLCDENRQKILYLANQIVSKNKHTTTNKEEGK